MSRSPAPAHEIETVRAFGQTHERHCAPLRLLTGEAETRAALPVLATAGDVRELVQHLKRKPAGVSVVEALAGVKRRVFEPRKVAAYEAWGLVVRAGDRLHLSAFGHEFAARLEPATEAFRALLAQTESYRAALAWIHEENLELVTHADLTSFWQERDDAALADGEKISEACAVSFFHLCQAAELGTMTTGKRGQPSRLRVEREELARFIEERRHEAHAAGLVPPQTPNAVEAGLEEGVVGTLAVEPASTRGGAHRRVTPGKLRVLVSGSDKACALAQIETALELADVEFRTVERRRGAHALISDEAMRAMRECEAALFIITNADFCETEFDHSLFIEIVAAYALYEGRVLLLCEERLSLPAQLDELTRMSFGGDELTWNEGIRLARAVKEFRTSQ
jgi:hypothetical protein